MAKRKKKNPSGVSCLVLGSLFGAFNPILVHADFVNGICRVGAFVPLTNRIPGNNPTSPPTTTASSSSSSTTAFTYAAALQLAVDHFNQRNPQIVPQLPFMGEEEEEESKNSSLSKCTVQIPYPLDMVDTQGGENSVAAMAFYHKTRELSYQSGRIQQLQQQQQQQRNVTCNSTTTTTTTTNTAPMDYCAWVGATPDWSAMQVSALAQSVPVPWVVSGGLMLQLVIPEISPYTTRTLPGSITLASVVARYLFYIGRDNFVTTLYPLTTFGAQLVEVMRFGLDFFGIRTQQLPYSEAIVAIQDASSSSQQQRQQESSRRRRRRTTTNQRDLHFVLDEVKRSGFRTIVWIVDDVLWEVPRMVAALNATPSINRKDYVWILVGNDDQLFHLYDNMDRMVENYNRLVHNSSGGYGDTHGDDNEEEEEDDDDDSDDEYQQHESTTTKKKGITVEEFYPLVESFLHGAAILRATDGFLIRNESDDRFLRTWRAQNSTFVRRVQDLYGIEGIPNDFFQTNSPLPGVGYLFDAVVAVGMGACLAEKKELEDRSLNPWTGDNGSNNNNTNNNNSTSANNTSSNSVVVTSEQHNEGIRNAAFEGASGHVFFREIRNLYPGGRDSCGTLFAAYNILAKRGNNNSHSLEYKRTDFLDNYVMDSCDQFIWQPLTPFVYADGTTVPPKLLRDIPDQNYMSESVRSASYVVLAVSWLLLLGSSVWIMWNREQRVLRAAQPKFLYTLHFGAAVMMSVILPLSLDESRGLSTSQLSMACTSIPWLFGLGYITTYMALFSKLSVINKLLRYRDSKLGLEKVLWVFRILLGVTVLVLVIWTATGGLEYRRVEIDEETGESAGSCTGDNIVFWFATMVVVFGIATIMTTYIAWMTKDVDETYAESWWILTAICTQIQVMVVCIPTLFLLNGQSSSARHIGLTLMLFTASMSITGLVMTPKFYAAYFADETDNISVLPRRFDSRAGRTSFGSQMPSSISITAAPPPLRESAEHSSSDNDNDYHGDYHHHDDDDDDDEDDDDDDYHDHESDHISDSDCENNKDDCENNKEAAP